MSIHLLRQFGITKVTAGGGGGYTDTLVQDPLPSLAEVTNTQIAAGFRFTVGASDITVNTLRLYFLRVEASMIVRIKRVSDNVVMAEATLDTVANEWAEGSVTPVVLASGVQYDLFAFRGSNFARTYGSFAGFTFNAAFSAVTGRNESGDTTGYGFPTCVDMGFTI